MAGGSTRSWTPAIDPLRIAVRGKDTAVDLQSEVRFLLFEITDERRVIKAQPMPISGYL
jgi:hypothetical protein